MAARAVWRGHLDVRNERLALVLLGTRNVPNGSGQCTFLAPSSVQATVDAAGRDSKNLGPLGDARCLALKRNHSRRSAVANLRLTACPSNVARLIPAIIVDAVEFVKLRRTLANVCEEVRKGMEPPIADCDSAIHVAPSVQSARVVASPLHRTPRAVRGGAVHSVCTSNRSPARCRIDLSHRHRPFDVVGQSHRPASTGRVARNILRSVA